MHVWHEKSYAKTNILSIGGFFDPDFLSLSEVDGDRDEEEETPVKTAYMHGLTVPNNQCTSYLTGT